MRRLTIILLLSIAIVLATCANNVAQLAPMPETVATAAPEISVPLSSIATIATLPSSSIIASSARRSETSVLDMAMDSYEDFLNGKIDAISYKGPGNERGEYYTINVNRDDFWGNNRSEPYSLYALFDMNGDNIPELHIRNGISYEIFTYIDTQPIHWFSGVVYDLPTDNGAILYTRHGAAPTHMSYMYRVLDFYGNTVLELYFQKFVHVEEQDGTYYEVGGYNEYGLYEFDGVEVSKSQWDALTERYLSCASDLIVWYQAPEGDIVLTQDMME